MVSLVNHTECVTRSHSISDHQVTSSLLVLGSIIVVARQFFGEPIRCDAGTVSNCASGGVTGGGT